MLHDPKTDQQIEEMLNAMRATGTDGNPVFKFDAGERTAIYGGMKHAQETADDVQAGAVGRIERGSK